MRELKTKNDEVQLFENEMSICKNQMTGSSLSIFNNFTCIRVVSRFHF